LITDFEKRRNGFGDGARAIIRPGGKCRSRSAPNLKKSNNNPNQTVKQNWLKRQFLP